VTIAGDLTANSLRSTSATISVLRGNVSTTGNLTVGGLNSASSTLTGGTINSMVIGGTTPASATVTLLTANNTSTFGGNIIFTQNIVHYIQLADSLTGAGQTLSIIGANGTSSSAGGNIYIFAGNGAATSSLSSGPGTFATSSCASCTIDWTSLSNASTSNDLYASSGLPTLNSRSFYLQATNFGFNIPAGATINGIVVEAERLMSGLDAVRDNSVQIIKGGTLSGIDHASTTNWSTIDRVDNFTTSTTDLWGTTWSADDINASNFGIAISAKNPIGPDGAFALIDYIRITVYYNIGVAGSLVLNSGAGVSSTISIGTSSTPKIVMVPNGGSVGIGTDRPSSTLHVIGDLTVNGKLAISSSTAGGYAALSLSASSTWQMYTAASSTVQNGSARDLRWTTSTLGNTVSATIAGDLMRLDITGNLFVDNNFNCGQGTCTIGVSQSADLAESTQIVGEAEDYPDGTIVAVAEGLKAEKAGKENKNFLGIATDRGMFMGLNAKSLGQEAIDDRLNGMSIPDFEKKWKVRRIAIAGYVRAQVNNENGDIKSGDLLTVANELGLAKKAKNGDLVIARARESFKFSDTSSTPSSTSNLIEVVIGNVAGSFANSDINLDPEIVVENSILPPGLAGILNDLKKLGIEIGQGILKAPTLVANIFRINNAGTDAVNNTIGRAVINSGQQWIEINNMKVEDSSQIFITPNRPVAIAVCEQKAGIGFKVCLSAPATEEISFSWWIIGVDGGSVSLPVSETPLSETPLSETTSTPSIENVSSAPTEEVAPPLPPSLPLLDEGSSSTPSSTSE